MRRVASGVMVAAVVGAFAACSGTSQTNPWENGTGSSSGAVTGSSGGGSGGHASSTSSSGAGSGGSTSGSGGSTSGGASSSGSSGSTSGSGSGASSSGSSGSTSGSGSSSGGVDAGDTLAAARSQCVQLINQYRATLSPPSPALAEASTSDESCVDGQAQADYTANTPHSAFGQCQEYAQDECPGWPGPPSDIDTKCLQQMWAEGPPPAGQDNHWLNMSNAQYTKVACGYYQDPQGSWWATQDFW